MLQFCNNAFIISSLAFCGVDHIHLLCIEIVANLSIVEKKYHIYEF